MRKLVYLPILISSMTIAVASVYASVAPVVVGGDRDSHGCIGSAGYSWDSEVSACIRPWEKASYFGKPLGTGVWNFHRFGTAFDVRIRYPRTGAKALDKAVVAYLRSAITEFKTNSIDPAQAVLENGQKSGTGEIDDFYDGSVTMNIDFESMSYRGLASVTMSNYQYLGGAHGVTDFVNFNADLKTGKVLTDADIFKDPTAAHKKLSDLIYAKLIADSSDRLYDDHNEVKRALLAENGGLQVLRFTPEGLEFQSQLYQVGQYAAGTVYETIAYSDILDLFVDDIANRLDNRPRL